MKIFTWHIHGSYLYYLSQGNYEIYIPTLPEKTNGYYGRGETFPFADNVIEIPAEQVKHHNFDCILFQSPQNYLKDQFEILSDAQRLLPKIYLEHDPPWGHPSDSVHIVNNPNVTLVHVTHFNKLMWNNNSTPTVVIEHGVTDHSHLYSGELEKGIVVINNLPARGRLLGFDIFKDVSRDVPLDLAGMGTGDYGIGEILHPYLPAFECRYRFFFNPIRYTSLGLAVCEAMMMGIPVIALATTELATVIKNGSNGYIHTDINYLKDRMNELIEDKYLARTIGMRGREYALKRFGLKRFTNEWERLFDKVTGSLIVHAPETNAILI